MTQTDPTPNTLPDGAHVEPADGGGAVSSDTLTLAEMNSYLGKDFKDKETALKAVKDTFSFVGKRQEDIEAEVRAKLSTAPVAPADSVSQSELKSVKDELFYTQNPKYTGYRDVIARMGGDPAEVVASSEFKKVFERVQVADEADAKKSIVSSNPKLAQNKGVVESAVAVANARNSTNEDVATVLAKGILEADA